METRILFLALLPTVALAFALAVGGGDDRGNHGTVADAGSTVRTGTTMVEPALRITAAR